VPTKNTSAGLLLYRQGPGGLEVLLAHPGGPFFRNKDAGSWTIPKGEPADGEDALATARREFFEETGLPVAEPLLPLGEIRQKAGKVVSAWAFAGEVPPGFVPRSNTFDIEWPPRSGRRATFPEIDRAELFPLEEARRRINPAQAAFLDRLVALLGS
jgi:predicted NUDIX family NTP pyrophosphohydrolase